MNENNLIETLSNLVQLDIDAVHAYDQALKEIEDPNIRNSLLKFQDNHRNHISGLSLQIKELGGQPPEYSQDIQRICDRGLYGNSQFHWIEKCACSHENHRRGIAFSTAF